MRVADSRNAFTDEAPIRAEVLGAYGDEGHAVLIQGRSHEAPDLFPFPDPFGLRRAVVPVLLNDIDGTTKGMGTAFHIDGWGTLLTAEHVVERVRRHGSQTSPRRAESLVAYDASDVYLVLLLGYGLIYGRRGVPAEALAVVASVRSPIRKRDDPLAAIIGRSELEAASDIAVMQLSAPVPEKMIGVLGVRLSGVPPQCGDRIVALGFPQLECQSLDEEGVRYLLSDGMSAAYGRIVGIHPHGLRGDPTPVIEVEANWPSGMSGGPVLNDQGEVIGVVSRSWTPSSEGSGRGCAACLQLMPWLRQWLPTVDIANPGWRVGWAVVKISSEEFIGVYASKPEALRHQQSLGCEYSVVFGSTRIGSDDFIPARSPTDVQL